jgi:hypothetical protein
MPPFGTIRNQEGFLIPSPFGAWLLADGRHVAGQQSEDAPEENAQWRGYYDCAYRVLELYVQHKQGIERIAYQIAAEGWAFRDRKQQPRPINRDDVRRVVSNWRQYTGLSPVGRAKDQNASLVDDPAGVLYDTGRAVFPLQLLRKVAQVQEKRSMVKRPFGAVKVARYYALTGLLVCAPCEQKAQAQNNPKLRTRLSGVDQYGKLRYRHTEGVKCGSKARSAPLDMIEQDFGRLISLFTVRSNAEAILFELAAQSQYGFISDKDSKQFEQEKQQAIAKYRRKMENARYLFEDGDLTREEYLRRKEECQREIAHWEARTTEVEAAAIELRMCMEVVSHIREMWHSGKDEDRQQSARMLFEELVYDLDQQRIVSFTLKPWASRFLILRAALYEAEDDTEGENEKRPSLKQTSVLCPIGDFCEQHSFGFAQFARTARRTTTRIILITERCA